MLFIRFVIDIAMVITWALTLKYKMLWAGHEYVGAALFILFILHMLLNWRWFASLGKGTYNTSRIIRTVVNLGLLVAMVAALTTAPFIARAVDTGVNGNMTRATYKVFEGIHKAGGKLGFGLMIVHMFMHIPFFKNIFKKRKAVA